MKKRKIITVLLCVVLVAATLAGCKSGGSGDTAGLSVAYQYGIQYLPARVVKDQKLIEKYYDGDIKIDWQILNSGASISEGLVSGDLDIGFIGPPVAITGISAGAPYKAFSGISAIPNRLMTNDESVNSLKDIGKDDKLALVNLNSVQHIMLATVAKEILGDAHALDNNILGISHPDGMQALLSDSIVAQYTTLPYSMQEAKEEGIHEVKEVYDTQSKDTSIVIGVMNTALSDDNPELFEATKQAFAEAVEYMSNEGNFDAIAEAYCEDEGVTKEEMIELLSSPDAAFSTQIRGFADFVKFMNEEKFVENEAPTEISEYTFDGVDIE